MRTFGILSDGDPGTLFLYETPEDLFNAELDDPGFVPKGDTLIRIDAYTVLAVGEREAKS